MSFKMAAIPTNFDYISDSSGHTIVVLMAIPRFYWPKNPLEQWCNKEHVIAILFFKMAAIPTNAWA